MINQWLKNNPESDTKFKFKVIQFTEHNNTPLNEELKSYISRELINAYTKLERLKIIYKTKPREELLNFINQKLPSAQSTIIRIGDWGETITYLIVRYISKLEVPLRKLRWKFNKDKSVFGTDLFAHNSENIETLYYYEVKTSSSKANLNLAVKAYDDLQKNFQNQSNGITNFLYELEVEKENYDSALKYADILKQPEKYNNSYEAFLVLDSEYYEERIQDLLSNLNNEKEELVSPLSVTIVLIDNLRDLIDSTFSHAPTEAVNFVHGA